METIDSNQLEIHPAADVFPLLEGAEFEALVEDIKSNGQQTAILLDAEGRVLDGRNRLRACRAAGVEPRFEPWSGSGSPLEAVISLNVRRRHLNESQRALVAARLAPQLKRYERTGESSANLRNFGRAGRAGAMLNVSPRLVEHAAKVLNSGNAELIQSVENGKLAVSAAARKLQPPRPEPKKLPAIPADQAMLLLWGPAPKLAEMFPAFEKGGLRYHTLRTDRIERR